MRKVVRPRDSGWRPVFAALLLISLAAVGTNLWLARRILAPSGAPSPRTVSVPPPSPLAPARANDNVQGTPTSPPLVLTTGPFNCDVVDALLEDPSLPDPVNWRSLAWLCSTSLRPRVTLNVVPAYRQRYLDMSNGTGIIPEAYVSFVRRSKYAKLTGASLKAASEFTDRPTLLMVTGEIHVPIEVMWPPEEYKNLIVFQRIDPPGVPLDYWFDKLYMVAMSPVLRGCLIESDTIITPNADHIFDILHRHGRQKFPLLATHMDERLYNCTDYSGPKTCTNIYYYYRERSMSYVHSNHISWTVHSKPFIANVLADCSMATSEPDSKVRLSPSMVLCTNDEDAMNWALWNANAKLQRCLDDPFPGILKHWEAMDSKALMSEHNRITTLFMFIHGSKDPKEQYEILERVRAMRGKPWVFSDGRWYDSPKGVTPLQDCLL